MKQLLLDVTQCVIFLSYFIISSIIACLFVRHRSYIDTWANRFLVVTAGLFLMLCALTHLYVVWHSAPPDALLVACAVVSFTSASCTFYTFRGLDDYLRLRITTVNLMREEIITNLTEGYDMKVRVSGNAIIGGVAGEYEVVEPYFVVGGFEVNRIIEVRDKYFRIANIVKSFVEVSADKTQTRESSTEEGRSPSVSMMYGYDATAEVRMRNESDRMTNMTMNLCMSTAHHVRTPLSCIGVALECIQPRRLGDEVLGMVEEVRVHCEILNMFVTQFVDFATVNSKVLLKPCVDYVDVRVLVERVEKVLARMMMEDVRCRCHVDARVPKLLLSDSDWIMQILLNLVASAAGHTFRGVICLTVAVENNELCIVVKDTGVHIPLAEKRALFSTNFADDAWRGYMSTGVGLYSVKTKVDALGGEYGIHNNPHGGTVLSVKVPVELDKKCRQRYVGKKDDNEKEKVTRVRSVLVVDDTPSVRKLMKRYLKGHSVEVAVNGAEGLGKMKEKYFDVVLLDLLMPVMDGVECLRRFRAWERYSRQDGVHQFVYCVSATSVELDTGFDGSILKPVDTRRLHRLLENLP